ncbi:hypothetical protein EVAR_101081_1 [Eumeta japonica]|uniref:Transposable element P transposase-like C-terminal domain-containing protein n=1 Tax=Eumeta variegata TaxID=151549 RepID=A0A4C1SLS6_EUMVA|nr:hypothetical protein EVAR_101081_1 [Eumeta japonica]
MLEAYIFFQMLNHLLGSCHKMYCNTFCPELEEDVEDLIEYCPEPFEETEFGDFDEAYLNDAGTLADDALEYLVGYTIHRLKLQEYESHSNSSS